MGRPRKPTALKLLAGNPGKRPLNLFEPQPDSRFPAMPDWMRRDKTGRACWKWLRGMLPAGVATQSDRLALELLCTRYAEWRRAVDECKQTGELSMGQTGPYQHPNVGKRNKAWKDLWLALGQFGMTPASRAQIVALPTETTDALLEFLPKAVG